MSLLHVALKDLTPKHLDVLVENAVREGRTIDYKRDMIGGADDPRREFLADVSSFANAGGGEMVLGMDEHRDAKNTPTGEPSKVVGLANVNRDATELRLLSMVRDGIAPRLQGVQPHWIERADADPVLILRVPRSWIGPHMVTFKNLSRFYSRNAGGKVQLDVGEIRQAFLGGETRRAELRAFRAERLGRILAQETPVPTSADPKVVFHAMPLAETDVFARIMGLPFSSRGALLPFGARGGSINLHHNLDGYVGSHVPGSDLTPYVQFFRSGHLETVGRAHAGPKDGALYVDITHIEGVCLEVFERWLELWKRADVTGPIVVGLSVTGVRGHFMIRGDDPFLHIQVPIDRDILPIDDVVLDDLSKPPDVLLKDVFDLLWQAGGWEESPHYNPDGRRETPRR